MPTRKFNRRNWLIAIIFLAIVIAGVFMIARSNFGNIPFFVPATVSQPIGDLPSVPNKPQPRQATFDNCPPQGEGGDSELNLLKNRVDAGNYAPVSFDTLIRLTWPKNVERVNTSNWPSDSRAFIAQYAGIPIVTEGYFASIKEAAPDAANCNLANSSNRDWNIFLTKNVGDELSQAVIVSVTPRVRASHKWNFGVLRSVVISDHLPVRVSGWLLFNPSHPEDVGQTRATLWEIHPAMRIDVFQNGKWIMLDKLTN